MADHTTPTNPADSCVFCERIASGAYGHASKDAVVFAPLNPVTPGHLLVVPRVHVKNAAEAPDVTAATVRLAALAASQIGPCNLITSVGREATQSVFHLHIHIVPRRPGDGLTLPWTCQNERDQLRRELEIAKRSAEQWEAEATLQARNAADLRARPSVSDQTPATPDDVVQSAVVADLRERAERYRDRCVGKPSDGAHAFAAQVLDHLAMGYEIALPEPTTPSSVQGDTTPRDDFDAIAAAEYRATSAPSEDTTGGQQ